MKKVSKKAKNFVPTIVYRKKSVTFAR